MNEEQNICAICRDDERDWDFLTRCGHYYHLECLQIACFARRDFNCPYCRAKISSSRQHESALRQLILERKTMKDISVKTVSELKEALERRPDLFRDPQRYHDAFVLALKLKRRFMVNFLISLTPFVNFRDTDGRSVLMVACWLGSLADVKRLVEAGADINATDNSGNSVLVAACKNRKQDIVEYLVGEGAEIYTKNMDNLTVFHWACSSGYPEIVEYFLKLGFDFKKLVPARIGIYEAAYISGSIRILEMLIENGGADVDETNFMGQNALFRIPRLDEPSDFLKMLLETGIDPHLTDKRGRNALCHYVANCEHGVTSIVKLFIEAGLDANQSDNRGMRPVHYACLNDRKLEILELFFNSETSFNVQNSDGQYPYDLALEINPLGKVQEFLENYELTFSKASTIESLEKSCEKCKKQHVRKECPNVIKVQCKASRIKRIY